PQATPLEPFPYRIDPTDERLCLTADLITPDGFGEICAVAEKSWRREELAARLAEKGKSMDDETYAWVGDLRDFGAVPHTAFERVMGWFVRLSTSRKRFRFRVSLGDIHCHERLVRQ
ncbi:hypothetical protein ACHAQH_001239, partial [Verticillium albo-atrum]